MRTKSFNPGMAVLIFVLLFLLSGCQFDFNVSNPNAPDRKRAVSDPMSVENLIAGSYLNWWNAVHYTGPSFMLSTIADEISCSWGLAGSNDMSSEPRKAWTNRVDYPYSYSTEHPWSQCYQAVTACADGLSYIQDGCILTDDAGRDQTPRAEAFARFVMGISFGFLGCLFDRAFIVDETTDLQEDIELKSYGEVIEAAVDYLEDCIALCESHAFQLPDSWINGNSLNQDELKALAHAYAARYLAAAARSIQERDAADWEAVAGHALAGIGSDFFVQGDGVRWFSTMHYLGQNHSWSRADYRSFGPCDTSGQYEAWLDAFPHDRQPFFVWTPDLRCPSGVQDGRTPLREGTDFSVCRVIPFNPARGVYHFSWYTQDRYEEHFQTGGVSPMPEFLRAEIDLILAEYYLRKGDGASAAQHINLTRTARGGLDPVHAGDGIGSVTDARSIFGSLWAVMKYEKGIECWLAGMGNAYFDRRGWGSLVPGTPVHFPIPARELEILGLPLYTFGGGGPGSAPE